jgi:lipopolysaccharide/colanic/teichoic acid biosynthesis glycosyltransferase
MFPRRRKLPALHTLPRWQIDAGSSLYAERSGDVRSAASVQMGPTQRARGRVEGSVTTVEVVADAVPLVLAGPTRMSGMKRAIDVVLGVPLCLVALPLVGVLAVIVTLLFRTWPLFVHLRIGHRGRVVAVPKLRTLAPGTPIYADKTVTDLGPHSRFANALRSTHLDELPQLFLVPVGRLSLIGPRPRMASEVADHGDTTYEVVRTSVLQGCTGLWQVSGHRGRVSDRPEYDDYYVREHTLRLDAWILWRTLRQLFVSSTIELADIPSWTRRRPQVT